MSKLEDELEDISPGVALELVYSAFNDLTPIAQIELVHRVAEYKSFFDIRSSPCRRLISKLKRKLIDEK